MANTATIPEDTVTRRDERRLTAEQAHAQQIPENYRKLLLDNSEDWAAGETRSEVRPSAAPVMTATLERAPAMPAHESVAPAPQQEAHSANAAQRIADYVAYAPAKNKPRLFEGLIYKDGELIDLNAPAAAAPAVAAPAPAQMPVQAPAAPAAPVAAPSEEDALPTRRTMETLRRGVEMTEEGVQTGTGLLSSLSLKTKLILCAIAAAVVLIIALICVNTGILSSANADIVVKEAQLRDLQTQYAQMQEELNYLQSPEYIDAWAQENGMVRGE